MSLIENVIKSYMESEYYNRRRVLNEPQARGELLAGAKLFFYERGTTNPYSLFSDSDRLICLPNPVIADSRGKFGDIYLPFLGGKIQLETAEGRLLAVVDNVDNDYVIEEKTEYMEFL